MTADLVLEVRDLVVEIQTARGAVRAVDGVSFDVKQGEVLAIVGESGSGKSLTMLAVMGLLSPNITVSEGSLRLAEVDLLAATPIDRRSILGRRMAMIFQDPMTSLNPVIRVGRQVAEMIRIHDRRARRADVARRVEALLDGVGIPDPGRRMRAFPNQLSGGQRQRVMIAMAMANEPQLLIADEPTTALDVTIQSSIMSLLRSIRARLGSAMVLVTHDLGLVAENADRVLVMYSGRIVEEGTVDDIFYRTAHPYTAGLLSSMLTVDTDESVARAIPGQPPEISARPAGCAFEPRCAVGNGRAICKDTVPVAVSIGSRGQRSACHFPDEVSTAYDSPGAVA